MDAFARQFSAVVWQKGKPPLDSELNLMSLEAWESLRQVVRTMVPSGFFMDPTRADVDFQFNPNWANRFRLGNPRTPTGMQESPETQPVVWANVNGWVLPIAGTQIDDLSNVISLMAPPESDTRIDYVFLEAWQTRVDANPSTANKPEATKIFKYGNVLFGGTNIDDDLEDPTIGYDTTARIQVQYRLRVHGGGVGNGSTVTLNVYPDGLGDPYIYGQGTFASPVALLGAFENMRTELGDPSLWRAGNGDPDNSFGTVDGYVYAIPVCAIFRRGSNDYSAVQHGGGNPTHNGSFDRMPMATHAPNPTSRELQTPLLTSIMLSTDLVIHTDPLLLGASGLDDPYMQADLSHVFLVIDNEIVGVSAVDTNTGDITIPAGGRGRFGTAAAGHLLGAPIKFYNNRPDGLFADEIARQDVLDLRHAINAQDWDYNRLLAHNVAALTKGTLKSAWKQESKGTTIGPVIHEVDSLLAGSAIATPNYTTRVDGPDGIRTVWSDAAALQTDVTIMCDNEATQDQGTVGITTDPFDVNVTWDVGPDFHPSGFMNDVGGTNWTDGSSILLFTGGEFGNQGVRGTFKDSGTRGVRLVTPKEYWKTGYPIVDPANGNQNPVSLRFVQQRGLEAAPPGLSAIDAARHVGPMYPWRETNFERPFVVLGSILHTSLRMTNILATKLFDVDIPNAIGYIDVGVDFDNVNWFSKDIAGNFQDDPTLITNPLFHDLKTLYGMLTDGGRDSTGASSEVYVVLYGDDAAGAQNNNGAFKVIGAGMTAGYTNKNAPISTGIVVQALSPGFTTGGFNSASGGAVTIEFRSQYTHSEDLSVYNPSRWADVAVVLTDVAGLTEHPWKKEYLGFGAVDGYDLSLPASGVPNKMILNTTFMYHPGHGATARVADELVRFARVGSVPSDGPYLRQSPIAVDPTFPGPAGEMFWNANHVQLWNRLPGLGWHAPFAPNYGGNVVGFTEQDREHELFVDRGSKTIIFRPFRSRDMTLDATDFTGFLPQSLMGPYTYTDGGAKDCNQIFTGTPADGKKMGFAVPYEFMPRFGRQDIPYYKYIGESPQPFMPGINHLFLDREDVTRPVFNVIGGEDNPTGGNQVKNMLFVTGLATYAHHGTTTVGTNNQPYIAARKTTSINNVVPYAQNVIDSLAAVNSSDFGRGLKGIQLPPYYGVARLIGVYDYRDFVTKGGRTIDVNNRWGADNDAAPNLLREDVDSQTLFILRDGAQDITSPLGGPQQTGDHTYIVPSNVLDLTRALQYGTSPHAFEDFQFVVVCTVFGFARDFINGNNFVLCRKHSGKGSTNVDGTVFDSVDTPNELEGVSMVIPCPASSNDQFYAAYNRTVYQGDVYMSRKGTVSVASDYEERYGQLDSAAQYNMRWPIQQYNNAGGYVPETPNARAFEVLASMDFYTTMGTGKVGGQMYPGTPLDVGYVQNTPQAALRATDTVNDPQWQTWTRTYTEGQKTNPSRATLSLMGLGDGSLLNVGHEFAVVRVTLLDGSIQDFYFCANAGNETWLNGQGVPSTNIMRMDIVGDAIDKINNHPAMQRAVKVSVGVDKEIIFLAVPVGAEGNGIRVSVYHTDPTVDISTMLQLRTPFPNTKAIGAKVTGAYFFGGMDEPMNAGMGFSQVNLTGMIERLPTGALLQDSDFLCENPLGDKASAMKSSPAGPRPIQNIIPLTNGGDEYDRFMGEPGALIAESDGSVTTTDFGAWRQINPTGTTIFRLYRGGGPLFVLSDDGISGGPVDWVSDSFPASIKPVLKGGVLVCRAMLVRNFYEEVVAAGPVTVTQGDEIQMVIATYGILGDTNIREAGLTLGGIISPAGYGEGYAASDRFRLAGRPMFKGYNRQVPNPADVTLAVYPDELRQGRDI